MARLMFMSGKSRETQNTVCSSEQSSLIIELPFSMQRHDKKLRTTMNNFSPGEIDFRLAID